MTLQVEKRLFTIEDYYRMAETGILRRDDRVELIRGEIVRMSPVGSLHAACVKRTAAEFFGIVGTDAIVSVQDPIRLAAQNSEPEPDISLLRPKRDYYASAHPTPADVLLVVEVSDSSLDYDRAVKLQLYAEAGIPKYGLWRWKKNASSDIAGLMAGNIVMCAVFTPAKASRPHCCRMRG